MTLKRLDNGEIYFGEAKWTPLNTIECLVKMEETDEVLPFHATPYDDEDYGRELFEMLRDKYSPSVAPCSDEERSNYLIGNAKSDRAALLRQTDWIANGDVRLVNQTEWLQYRQDLRDITLQPGYPEDITWPTRPDVTYSTPIDDRIKAIKRQ